MIFLMEILWVNVCVTEISLEIFASIHEEISEGRPKEYAEENSERIPFLLYYKDHPREIPRRVAEGLFEGITQRISDRIFEGFGE